MFNKLRMGGSTPRLLPIPIPATIKRPFVGLCRNILSFWAYYSSYPPSIFTKMH